MRLENHVTIGDRELDVYGCGPYSVIVIERKIGSSPAQYLVSIRDGLLCLRVFGPFEGGFPEARTFALGAEAFTATMLVTGRLPNPDCPDCRADRRLHGCST